MQHSTSARPDARRTTQPNARRTVAGLALGLLASGLAAVQLAPAASADTRPPAGALPGQPAPLPATVSADALPAPSIAGGLGGGSADGVVWATAMAGDVVFAGGNFTRATDPTAGAAPVDRSFLLAFDVTTGRLTDFTPELDQQVRALALSPDGETLYVAGDFARVEGRAQRGLAAYDVGSGELVDDFDPALTSPAAAVAATGSTVYVGGSFGAVGTVARGNLAAFTADDGDLTDWAPTATGGPVTSLTVKPTGDRLAVGGYFTALNGSSNPGYGLGLLDTTTGASLPMDINRVVRNARPAGRQADDPDGAIFSLSSTSTALYGTGFTYQTKDAGTLEGVFSATWDGDITWINDCHGDAYDVQPIGEVVYAAGHTHYCENLQHGGVRQGPGGVGEYPYFRGIAMTAAATGTASWEPDQGRYFDFQGQPTPTMLGWYPDFNQGQFTGQSQGPWTVTGNSDYVVMGGEFTRVNRDTGRRGLVVFATSAIAPNKIGPQYCGTLTGTVANCANGYPINLSSTAAGEVHVGWSSNRDNDNETLTYRVRRREPGSAVTTLVHRRDVFAPFWNPVTMGVTDTGLTPGATYEYRVEVTDPFGNPANSAWTPVTVAAGGTTAPYARAVLDDEPASYWRLGEPAGSGGVSADAAGFSPLTTGAGVARGTSGALPLDADPAFTFDGSTAGTAVAGDLAASCSRTTHPDLITGCWPPDVMTLETWFKTSATTGGRMVGWSNRATGNSTKHDRQLYLDDEGRVRFGVRPDDRRLVVASDPGLNDGQWHHAVGTLSPAGLELYVDGRLVAARDDVRVGEHLSIGTWRLGGDTLAGWPGQASGGGRFTGSLDEVAVYKRRLAADEVGAHYTAATGGTPGNRSPLASFVADYDPATTTVTVDASGSTDPDGSVVSYAWDFGDGTTATGARASHSYTAGGRYEVTLRVTDDDGAVSTRTTALRVVGAPLAAVVVEGASGLQVQVSGRDSVDLDGGSIQQYEWSWGDGTPVERGTNSRPRHTYAQAGTYDVTLTVTDDEGATSTATVAVTVPNLAPVPQITVGGDGLTVRVDSAGTVDPDGTVTRYAWRFGDGALGVAEGRSSLAATSYTYRAPGTYTIRLDATDEKGATGTVRYTVTLPLTGPVVEPPVVEPPVVQPPVVQPTVVQPPVVQPPVVQPPEVEGTEASAIEVVRKPRLRGVARVGRTLSVTRARWSVPVTVSYRWLVNGKPVRKATSSRLRLTGAMAGKRVSVVLTARAPGVPSVRVTLRLPKKVSPPRPGRAPVG